MSTSDDSRTCGRIPIAKPVQVVSKGRAASYALAINIGLGGLLLSASPALPVGSQCKLAIPPADDSRGDRLLVEGTVIRNDSHGMAVQFARQLENSTFEAIAKPEPPSLMGSLVISYLNYFQVSQHKEFEGSQQLLGVSPGTFRTVFLSSFLTCIPLAIIPVWMIKDSILLIPNWVKILLSFGYATIWFALIQPLVDLMVFKIIKKRALIH